MSGSLAAPCTRDAPWCVCGAGANCTHRTTLSKRVVRGALEYGDRNV